MPALILLIETWAPAASPLAFEAALKLSAVQHVTALDARDRPDPPVPFALQEMGSQTIPTAAVGDPLLLGPASAASAEPALSPRQRARAPKYLVPEHSHPIPKAGHLPLPTDLSPSPLPAHLQTALSRYL